MADFDPALIRALIDTSNLGLLIVTAEFQVELVNSWLKRHLPSAPPATCALADLFPELPASTTQALAQVIKTRQPCLLTSAFRQPIFPLPDIPAELFRYQSARIIPLEQSSGIAIIIEDVSETTATAQALREQTQALADAEARQRALITTIGEAIIVTTLEGWITDWNPAAERIYGWRADEVLGQPIAEILAIQFEDPSDTLERSTATMRREGIWRGRVIHRRKDEAQIYVASTIALLHDAHNQPVGMVAVNRDITESKRLGAKLNRLERMNRAISRGLTIDDILATLMVEVRDLLLFDRVGLALFTSEGMAYNVQAAAGPGQPLLIAGERVSVADSLLAVVRASHEPLILADICEHNFAARPVLEAEGVRALMLLPLVIGNEVIGVIYFGSYQMGIYTPHDAELMTTTAEQVAIALNTARLFEDTQRQVRQLTALYEGGLAVSRPLDPVALAQETVRVLRALVEFDTLAVLLIDEMTHALEPFALDDKINGHEPMFALMGKNSPRARQLRVGKSVPAWVAQHGQPVRLGDVAQDPRYVAAQLEMRSELCVPLKVGERVIGVIDIETTRSNAYTDDDTRLLLALAGPLAVAIDNARLYGEAQRTETQMRDLSLRLIRAQEEERGRLAHELHDEVGQTLTILKLNLQSILAIRIAHPPDASAVVESLNIVSQLLDQIRQLSLNLRPSLLDDFGLAPALRWYLDRAAQRSELTVRFDTPPHLGRFSTDIETVLFRIVQESVTNVLRHARAQNLWVQLTERSGTLELQVTDDGVGFDLPPGASASSALGGNAGAPIFIDPLWVNDNPPLGRFHQYAGKTLGLSGIAERAALIGAELEIDSTPGKGTNILVRVTLENNPAEVGLR